MVQNSVQLKTQETDSVDERELESRIAIAAVLLLPALVGAYPSIRGLAGFGVLKRTMLAAGSLLTWFGFTGEDHRSYEF